MVNLIQVNLAIINFGKVKYFVVYLIIIFYGIYNNNNNNNNNYTYKITNIITY